MASVEQITKGAIARFNVITRNASGARINADSIPTIFQTHVDSVAATITGATIVQKQDATPANIPGYYEGRIPTSSLAIGAQLDVLVQAVIGGFTAEETYSFNIVEAAANSPYIDG